MFWKGCCCSESDDLSCSWKKPNKSGLPNPCYVQDVPRERSPIPNSKKRLLVSLRTYLKPRTFLRSALYSSILLLHGLDVVLLGTWIDSIHYTQRIIMSKRKRKSSQKPLHPKKIAKWQHKNATSNFDYTLILDRLRTVSWSDESYSTDGVTGSQPSY